MTYTTTSGCDSVITLDLIIYSTPSVVIVQNTTDPSLWDAIANGGTSPYTYAWSGLQFSSSALTVGPLVNGHYCVEVTDANGCISNSDCIDILPSSVYDLNVQNLMYIQIQLQMLLILNLQQKLAWIIQFRL